MTKNYYRWILLQQEGCIAGFYYENVNSGIVIKRIGVTGDGTPARATALPPQYYNCEFPWFLKGMPNTGLFLSLAVLSGLERVDVCRVYQRRTGMLIHYTDGQTKVLGQWHASCPWQHSCIYNGSGPAISNIYFRMSKAGNSQIVTDISFSPNTVETTPDSDYVVFSVREVRLNAHLDT